MVADLYLDSASATPLLPVAREAVVAALDSYGDPLSIHAPGRAARSLLDDGRVAIAALAVGCIQACLDLSVQYAGERTTFGVPIGAKQGVAFQIADLAVMAQAGRALVYQAAAMKDAWDFYDIVQAVGGDLVAETCEGEGFDPKKPLSAQI